MLYFVEIMNLGQHRPTVNLPSEIGIASARIVPMVIFSDLETPITTMIMA